MIGIAVPKMSAIVNRTTRDINGMFNGQPLVIPAGYKRVLLPKMKTIKGKTVKGVDGAPDTREPDTTEPVMKDGQPVLEEAIIGAGPGGAPLTVMLPDYAAEMVKRQNVVMGTEDPENPRDVQYLIGFANSDSADDISHVEQSEAIERLDRGMMDDDARSAQIRGARRKPGRQFSDGNLYNPGGIRGDVGPANR